MNETLRAFLKGSIFALGIALLAAGAVGGAICLVAFTLDGGDYWIGLLVGIVMFAIGGGLMEVYEGIY